MGDPHKTRAILTFGFLQFWFLCFWFQLLSTLFKSVQEETLTTDIVAGTQIYYSFGFSHFFLLFSPHLEYVFFSVHDGQSTVSFMLHWSKQYHCKISYSQHCTSIFSLWHGLSYREQIDPPLLLPNKRQPSPLCLPFSYSFKPDPNYSLSAPSLERAFLPVCASHSFRSSHTL